MWQRAKVPRCQLLRGLQTSGRAIPRPPPAPLAITSPVAATLPIVYSLMMQGLIANQPRGRIPQCCTTVVSVSGIVVFRTQTHMKTQTQAQTQIQIQAETKPELSPRFGARLESKPKLTFNPIFQRQPRHIFGISFRFDLTSRSRPNPKPRL